MVVLATKCYVEGSARKRALDSLDSLVANDLADLDVDWTIGVLDDEFVSVTVEGDDETVAQNLLRDRWGEITDHFEDGETYVGTLRYWDDEGWTLDAGRPIEIAVDDRGLGPGDGSQIRDRFGGVQHTPLSFVYDDDGDHRLAEESRDTLYGWTRNDGDGADSECEPQCPDRPADRHRPPRPGAGPRGRGCGLSCPPCRDPRQAG